MAIKGFREGVVPETSPLANPNIHTFVATNSSPSDSGEIAVALESHGDGMASLSLETRSDRAAHDVTYLRRVLQSAVEICEVRSVVTDLATTTLQSEMLKDLNFRALETGEYELSKVA